MPPISERPETLAVPMPESWTQAFARQQARQASVTLRPASAAFESPSDAQRQEIPQLQATLRQHDTAYESGNPLISDVEYDRLYQRLVELESQHPDLARADSPTRSHDTQTWGAFAEVEHATPMQSIDNTYTPDTLDKFDAAMQRLCGPVVAYSVEKKFDGLSLDLHYESGRLHRGLTRGNYEKGKDVTRNVLHIQGVPAQLDPQALQRHGVPASFHVRGEVMMDYAAFDRMNAQLRAEGQREKVSPRNAAAGILMTQNPEQAETQRLFFKAYLVPFDNLPSGLREQSAVLDLLRDLGFDADPPRVAHGMEEVKTDIETLRQERDGLPFAIDGAVIKLNDLQAQERAGRTEKSSKAMLAFKYNDQRAMTRVVAVDNQIGRTGKITPVARLQPVQVGDVTVTNATLHNYSRVAALDLRVGDRVEVMRGGDVIPEITRVDFASRPADATPILPPQACPCCDAPVEHEETLDGRESEDLRCTNAECDAVLRQRLVYFASKACMDLPDLGEKTLLTLFDAGKARHPDDLMRLQAEDLNGLPGIARKSAESIARGIEARKNVSLPIFLTSLGIRDVGPATAKAILRSFSSLDLLRDASQQDLLSTRDVDRNAARHLFEALHDPVQSARIDALAAVVGVKDHSQSSDAEPGPLTGKTVVVTGTLADLSREQAREWLESLGAKVTSSVSRKTTLVVLGTSPGANKVQAAQDYGIQTLTEAELRALCAPTATPAPSTT